MTLNYLRQATKGAAGLGQDGTLKAAEVEKMISMTDEKMREEVQEAEAVVDECCRRRARRAGRAAYGQAHDGEGA